MFQRTIILDSSPANPVHGFQQQAHGVVCFPFEEFAEELVLIENENYGCPFLKLLLHLYMARYVLLAQ
jgi:hypothetical protein